MMRAKLIYEKFEEESDPIQDLGIGNPDFVALKKDYQELGKYVHYETEDVNYRDVKDLLARLVDANMVITAAYFTAKYGMKFEPLQRGSYNRRYDKIHGTWKHYDVTIGRTSTGAQLSITLRDKTWTPVIGKNSWEAYISAGAQSLKKLEKNLKKAFKDRGLELK